MNNEYSEVGNEIPHISIGGCPGVGVTTTVGAMEDECHPEIVPRITSRPMRPGEQYFSREYRFVSPKEYRRDEERDFFIPESIRDVEVNGIIYHTAVPKRIYWPQPQPGANLLVSLFGKRVLFFREQIPGVKLVFIHCDRELLETRLKARCRAHGIDPTLKLKKVQEYFDLKIWEKYDYVVYNDGTPQECAREIVRLAGLTPRSENQPK